MNLRELRDISAPIIKNIKDHGLFPKENSHVDYKLELTISSSESHIDSFLNNFAKDIISFSNADGGVILIGIKENKTSGRHEDIGLNEKGIEVLDKIDLNDITQAFNKIAGVGVSIDLQKFQIGTKKFYYLVIEKSDQILIPKNNEPRWNVLKGGIYYRASGKNEHANISTSDFNRFLQIKANERSKEFMEIWSKLLPEKVDINPREVLILNPMQNRVYGFNSKDNTLSSSEVEIDRAQSGVFNIILNAISAGEIGRITNNEGKPIYKIVGELQTTKDHISMSSLLKAVKSKSKYTLNDAQLKSAIYHLEWVTKKDFKVHNPPADTVNSSYNRFIWIETVDQITKARKIYFSSFAIDELVAIIDDSSLHKKIFNRMLVVSDGLSKADPKA